MTAYIGSYCLCTAVLVAVVTLLVSLAAVRSDSQKVRRAARWGVFLLAGLLTLSCIALMWAMVNDDFRLAYVGRFTERALPVGYKMAAFWAGQEGSLLLWAWLLAVMSGVFIIQTRKQENSENAVAVGTLAAVIGFFAALMLFAANPFDLATEVAADGHGLNPMLQDPGMIAHPPILFMGYAGFTIPFALLMGALLAGKSGSSRGFEVLVPGRQGAESELKAQASRIKGQISDDWVMRSRGWALVSWLFLGVGIILGAQWAYTELGWGGYWAWDPVENASLLPWLTGTALLHSILGQRHRGVFKRSNAMLAAGTFLLCIFGTYITRGGVVESVHSFGKSLVGTFFLIFLALTTLLSLVLVLRRWPALRPEREIETLVSREGGLLAGNILLVLMMAVTLVGTMMPAFSNVSVAQPFYNRAILPMALVLGALMALAPLLPYGPAVLGKLVRWFGFPFVLAAAAVITLQVMHIHSMWAIVAAVVVAVVPGGILADLVRSFSTIQRQGDESLASAIFRLIAAQQRRYGAQIVHAGIAMIIAGVAGSSLYNAKETLQLGIGASGKVGAYTLKLEELKEVRGPNYRAAEARVTMTSPSGVSEELHPQKRQFDKWPEQPNTAVALRSNWREDLYVTLAGADDSGQIIALQVIVNPLVKWIWAGGVVLTLGGLVCLMPRLSPKAMAAAQPAAERRKERAGVRVALGEM